MPSPGASDRDPLATDHLERLTERRDDAAWLAARHGDPASRYVPVHERCNLVRPAGNGFEPVYLDADAVRRHTGSATTGRVFLGVSGGRAYFALCLTQAALDALAETLGARAVDLRRVGALMPARATGVLALARAMGYWHATHAFCGRCGSPTEARRGGHMRQCRDPQCAREHFPRVDPAVIVRVEGKDSCLLARQPSWPPGRYSVIAGFVEPGESLEAAVAREVAEETGVQVVDVRYRGSQPWPFPASIMLGFSARAVGETPALGSELEDARWYTAEGLIAAVEAGALRVPPPVSIAYRLIEEWLGVRGYSLRDYPAAWQAR